MIEIFKFSDFAQFGGTFVEQLQLRHKELITRKGWEDDGITVNDEIEADYYDNPETIYVVYRDEDYKVRGTIRMNPTTSPYMVEEVFRDFLHSAPIKDPLVWESSRLVIDQDASLDVQSRAWGEINVAGLEFNLARGIKKLIMFTPHWFVEAGLNGAKGMVKLEALGPVKSVDGVNHVASITEEITQELLDRQRGFTGIAQVTTRQPKAA